MTDSPSPDPVPFVDLAIQHQRIAADVLPAITQVLDTTSFILGPQVEAFEKAYARFCGVDHCVGVGNGTDAIELALRGAGIGPGDEVVLPANTFVATAEAVVRAGATIRLVDCDEDFLLDASCLADAVTPRTRAVIGVDLYGQVARFEEIRAAVGEDVLVVEDAAQSQGASRGGQPAGSFGHVAATSFYPGKNLGAYGDAGAVMTSDNRIDDRIRALRNHGGVNRYEHLLQGTNSRLDSIQAVVLSHKLVRLREWNAERQAAAAVYQELLGGTESVVVPTVVEGNEHVWHLFVVRVPRRDEVLAGLNALGIRAGIHYPAPVHLLPAFAGLGIAEGSFPVAEKLAGEILSLPIFPGITLDQQHRVAEALLQVVKARR